MARAMSMSKEAQRRTAAVRERKKSVALKIGIILVGAASLAAWTVVLLR